MNTSPFPTVSVVIPAFNAASTLAATLDSVFAQTRPALEVIVVDDGSSDDTPAVLREQMRTHERLRVITQDNQGLASARRAGVAAARGDLIALMDADDLCHPQRLALQVLVLKACPEMALCSSDFSAFNGEGPIAPSYASRYYSAIGAVARGVAGLYGRTDRLEVTAPPSPPGSPALPKTVEVHRGQVYAHLVHGNFVHPPTVMFRRELLDRVGNFDPQARSMCDWDWLTRAAAAGEFGHIDFPLLDYRLSDTQMSAPRHGIRASRDTLHVAQRICERDPALFDQARARFRAELFQYNLDAADACAEVRKHEALTHLLQSCVQGRRVSERSLRILFKILAPSPLIQSVRAWRNGLPRTVRH